MEEDVTLVQRRGYAVDNVEVEDGVACYAAPVLDFRGVPVAAISCAGPAGRILPREDTLGPRVAATASALSRRLGYVGPLREGAGSS